MLCEKWAILGPLSLILPWFLKNCCCLAKGGGGVVLLAPHCLHIRYETGTLSSVYGDTLSGCLLRDIILPSSSP